MVVNVETERVIRRVLGDMLPKLNEMQRRQLQGSIADSCFLALVFPAPDRE